MKAIRLFAPALPLAAALALLSSCSYLVDDPFPDYAQRMVACADLDALVKSTSGGSPLQSIDSIGYLESSGSSGVFVALHTKDGARYLLTLDGESLDAPLNYPLTYSFTEVGLAASGDYLFYGSTGWVALKPDSRAMDWTPSANLASISAYQALLSEGGNNYLPYVMSNTNLNVNKYDGAFAPFGSQPLLNIPIEPSSSSWNLVSAGQGKGYCCFLFSIGNSGSYRAFRTTSIESMLSLSSVFEDPALPDGYKTAEFSSMQSNVSLTVDGPVTVSNDNNGMVFTLMGFGSSPSTSSYTLKDMDEASYAFESSGKYWFLYDKKSGKLYKLRTWW